MIHFERVFSIISLSRDGPLHRASLSLILVRKNIEEHQGISPRDHRDATKFHGFLSFQEERPRAAAWHGMPSVIRPHPSSLIPQISTPMPPHKLTSSKKMATASQLYWSARDLKARTLRRHHPDWSESQIDQEVRKRFMFSPGLNR